LLSRRRSASQWDQGFSQLIDVATTFRENEILLTGANGFLGKIILGLLLDRYPESKHVHLLIRPRPGRDADERFERDILQSPAMKPLVDERGADWIRTKVTVWPGDAAEIDASGPQASQWKQRVRLILNCAGLVEFFPPVDQSLRANVDSIERLVALAEAIDARLLHISTCYVAGRADGLVEETEPILGFYPRRTGPADDSFDAAAELASCRERIAETVARDSHAQDGGAQRSRSTLQALVELGRQKSERWGWVNTYTYAKSLGEQILVREAERSGLAYAIVRPAIVESSLQFPFPGWIEGGRTAAPLVLMALGGLKEWPMRPDIALEVVPVDQVAAATLAVAALLLEAKPALEQPPVYQLATADQNPFELEDLVTLLDDEAARQSPNGGTRPPLWLDPLRRLRFLSAAQVRGRRQALQQRLETARTVAEKIASYGLPGNRAAARWSTALRTLGLQASFREQTLDQYLPFILENRYVFETHNIRQAYARLSPRDRAKLPWSPAAIDWRRYWVENQIGGIKKWVQPEAVREWKFKL
jgi:long-chain acyl-CoA synthetase